MILHYRPLEWTGPRPEGRAHSFRVSWHEALRQLDQELTLLEVDESSVVLQVETRGHEADFRMDGQLRADARVTWHGVILSFESRKHPHLGRIAYPCATYDRPPYRRQLEGWQANVRAITLGLEALRAVDRYGISSHGEQYAGWKAVGSGTPMPAASMTKEEAARFLKKVTGRDDVGTRNVMTEPSVAALLYRAAVRKLHPDAGGDAEQFRLVTEAYELLKATS